MTQYLQLQTICKNLPAYLGGICQLWYTPIENIETFPDVDPETQQLTGEPVLKADTTWYGPVGVPDAQRGWQQELQLSKPGPWYKQKITAFVPGNSINSHLNLESLAWYQVMVVAKLRAGGFYILLGNWETGMQMTEFATVSGEGANNTPGSQITLSWEGSAMILPSFDGDNSLQPTVGGGGTPTIIACDTVSSLTYHAGSTETETISLPALAGKEILLFFLESQLLDIVDEPPENPRQVQRDLTGDLFTFYEVIEEFDTIKVLYKNA